MEAPERYFKKNNSNVSDLVIYQIRLQKKQIRVAGCGNKTASFNIYDDSGKLLRSYQNINCEGFDIERSNLKAGVYFYKFIDDKQNITVGKLILI